MIRGTPDRTWGSMLTTLQNHLLHLQGEGIRKTLSQTDVDLDTFRKDGSGTIYLVFPPDKLKSHAPVFRTILTGLTSILVSRNARPERTTLFLLDEIAQLGQLDIFLAATTLLRGYGVQVWSFWQDLSQIRALYPDEWQTIVNNCRVFQAFGCATPLMAAELASIHALDRNAIFDLEDDEMVLSVMGEAPVIARKPLYWKDPAFSGQFDRNPLNGGLEPLRRAGPVEAGPSRRPVIEIRRRRVAVPGGKR